MTHFLAAVLPLAGFICIGLWAKADGRKWDRHVDQALDIANEYDPVFDLNRPIHHVVQHPSGWHIVATYQPGDVAAGAERILHGRER